VSAQQKLEELVMRAQPKIFIISDGGRSSDCTQIISNDSIFKPFMDPGMGQAKTLDRFSKEHLLMWL
jgi:hypothetical protein